MQKKKTLAEAIKIINENAPGADDCTKYAIVIINESNNNNTLCSIGGCTDDILALHKYFVGAVFKSIGVAEAPLKETKDVFDSISDIIADHAAEAEAEAFSEIMHKALEGETDRHKEVADMMLEMLREAMGGNEDEEEGEE